MNSLAIDDTNNDLMLDAAGNLALVSGLDRLAQDVSCCVRAVAGECIYDTTLGIRYFTDILGQAPNPALIKADVEAAALTDPEAATATVFLTGVTARNLTGQVQVTSTAGGTATVSL